MADAPIEGSVAAPPVPFPVLTNALPGGTLIPLEKFTDAARKRIEEIAATVSMADSNTIMTFGSGPQRTMNAFLDEMLQGIRTDETGAAGELILALAASIKAINLPKIKEELAAQGGIAGILAKLPLLGTQFSALRRFQETRKQDLTNISIKSRRKRPWRWAGFTRKMQPPMRAPRKHRRICANLRSTWPPATSSESRPAAISPA